MMKEQISLSLEELSREVAFMLEHYRWAGAAGDSRISAVPDARTIRYYTTLGLLDRPWIEGRQARYGKRHLLQLIAIKAFQAKGLPLAQIQSRLDGLSNEELEALLASMAEVGPSTARSPAIHPVVWEEVVIEPGLKLMVEEGWLPAAYPEDIQSKVHAALAALITAHGRQTRFPL